MEHVRTVEKTVTEKTYTCDVCGKKASYKCSECKRDLCGKHTIFYDTYRHDMTYPDFDGDYPSKICKECWETGEPERVEITRLNFEHEEAIEKLYEKWFEKCKGNLND